MARIDKDPFLNRWMSLGIGGLAVQVAAVTAYVPLGLIGPDPSREGLLLWAMPTWILGVTLLANWLGRKAYRRWMAN